jgi:hypothetical protein
MSWISYLIGRFSGGHQWPVLGGHRGHLQRLAAALSYPDAHSLCADISEITGDPPHVVDLIFWRYLAEAQGNTPKRAMV